MKKQKLLSDVLSSVIGRMSFPIEYKSITSTDTTVTLVGLCDIRHLQPGFTVTIDSEDYIVASYVAVGSTFNVVLTKTTGQPNPHDSGTFLLYTPKFFHGTPLQQENEFKLIQDERLKTPMIYLMEPYTSRRPKETDSSIYSKSKVVLCFLTDADYENGTTGSIQEDSMKPMFNLAQDFIAQLIESELFYTDELEYNITYFTKFAIHVKDKGAKETYFTQKLSGVTLETDLWLYEENSCCQDQNFLLSDSGMYLQVNS